MKQFTALLLALLCLSFAGCGYTDVDTIEFTWAATEPEHTQEATEAATEAVAEVTALAFSYQGVELIPGQSFDLSLLPEPSSTFTVPSCALDGTDNVYSYGDLEITAFNDGTGEFIYSLYLMDPALSTPEGLQIGHSQEQVIALYGSDFQDNGGEYLYTRGDVTLSILLQNGQVTAIEYILSTVNV